MLHETWMDIYEYLVPFTPIFKHYESHFTEQTSNSIFWNPCCIHSKQQTNKKNIFKSVIAPYQWPKRANEMASSPFMIVIIISHRTIWIRHAWNSSQKHFAGGFVLLNIIEYVHIFVCDAHTEAHKSWMNIYYYLHAFSMRCRCYTSTKPHSPIISNFKFGIRCLVDRRCEYKPSKNGLYFCLTHRLSHHRILTKTRNPPPFDIYRIRHIGLCIMYSTSEGAFPFDCFTQFSFWILYHCIKTHNTAYYHQYIQTWDRQPSWGEDENLRFHGYASETYR